MLSQKMAMDVKMQGDNINSLEDHIIISKDNAVKAEKEIKDAEKMTRSVSRKIMWLVFIICFTVIAIVLVMLMIFLPKNKEQKRI